MTTKNARSETVKRKFLLYTSAIIGVFSILALGPVISDPNIPRTTILIQACVLTACVASFILARAKKIWAGGIILSFGLVVAVTFSARPEELIHSTIGGAYILPIFVGGMIAGSGASIAMTVITVGTFLAMATINGIPITTPSYTILFILCITGGLCWFVFRSQKLILDEATEQAEIAKNANIELARREQMLLKQNEELRLSAYEQVRLHETVEMLESPTIPVIDGVLVFPLIGYLNEDRVNSLRKKILEDIYNSKSHTLILDVTGIQINDPDIGVSLMKLIKGVKLLGTKVIMTGFSGTTAQMMIDSKIPVKSIEIEPNLQAAIKRLTSQN